MRKAIVIPMLCVSLFATEQQTVVNVDSNNTAKQSTQRNPIIQKTIDFFSGALDDIGKFAENNQLTTKKQ